MLSPTAATDPQNGAILILITLVVLPIAALAFARSGEAWRSIGRGPMAIDEDVPVGSTREQVVREEVRQMLVAGNERRMRRGEQPLDIEDETERQLADL